MEPPSSFSRRKSEASKLVEGFQELNDRLSAFERLAQLKRMVVEGKLKQDVFEEMYRINAEKLADPRRRKSKKFEVKSLAVLDDFAVKHRSQHPNATVVDMNAVTLAKVKHGTLYFDRIVLRASSAFGAVKETILIGTQELTLIFYDDESRRVDLLFENKRQEQFLFESEVEKLMFVECLEKALDTAARSSTSKDEPVLLGRPSRTNSQVKKEFEARKSACINLEMMAASPALTKDFSDSFRSNIDKSFRSNVDSTSVYTDDVREFNEEDEEELERSTEGEIEVEEKDEEPTSTVAQARESSSATLSPMLVLSKLSGNSSLSPSSTDSASTRASSSDSIDLTPSPSMEVQERAHLLEKLEDAKRERTSAEKIVEEKKALALQVRKAEEDEQKQLHRVKAEEDETVKKALEAREEDVQAAKNLAECVANEIAALNALDPDDVLSSSTNKAGDESNETKGVFMSNDLRALIGQPRLSNLSPYARLQYNLQQARKALAAARVRVEKTSERRRIMETARRDARKVVSAQMSKCSAAMREVTRAETAVLNAKAMLTEKDERVAHFEQCLLIIDEHRKMRTPTSQPKSNFVEIGISPENKEAWMETSIIT